MISDVQRKYLSTKNSVLCNNTFILFVWATYVSIKYESSLLAILERFFKYMTFYFYVSSDSSLMKY